MHWRFGNDPPNCGECQDLYQGNPPCSDCDAPRMLQIERECTSAIRIWFDLSYFSRPASFGGLLPIPISEMLLVLEQLGEGVETYEQVKLIEQVAYPYLTKPKKP